MTGTDDTTKEKHTAIPELDDEEKLAIVQAQIERELVAAYQLECAATALPRGHQKLKQARAAAREGQDVIAGYRKLEAELLARLIKE